MKKYQTWEVIKMLTDNPKLKFKIDVKSSFIDKEKTYLYSTDNGYLVYEEDGKELENSENIGINDEWTLAQEPVSFIEAITSNKKIRVEHQYYNNEGNLLGEIFSDLGFVLAPHEIADVIKNGKWYIEED